MQRGGNGVRGFGNLGNSKSFEFKRVFLYLTELARPESEEFLSFSTLRHVDVDIMSNSRFKILKISSHFAFKQPHFLLENAAFKTFC
ncbi:hypothetical protein V6N13_096056 [Hibiscus sabdariffa]